MHTAFKSLLRLLGVSVFCYAMAQTVWAQGATTSGATSPSASTSTPRTLAAAPEPASTETPGAFASVVPGQALTFPYDRGAHPAFRTEWWYATGWLQQPDGKPLGFQITFFRSGTEHDRANPSPFAPTQLIIAHAALSNPDFGHMVNAQRNARQGFDLAYARSGDTTVKLDDWHMTRDAAGVYHVKMSTAALSLNLRLTPTQPLMQQGENGYSQKGPNLSEATYYYSEPQLRVSGVVSAVPATLSDVDAGAKPSRAATRIDKAGTTARGIAYDSENQTAAGTATALRNVAVTGSAWLDHEWSSTAINRTAVGWDWLGANMHDGSALMAFSIRAKDGSAIWAHAAWRDVDERVKQYGPDAVAFTVLRSWRSPRTEITYPVAQQLTTGTHANAIQWQLTPLFDDQEMDATQSIGAIYWEGAVRVTRDGKQVGEGYLELTGYDKPMDLQ